MTDVDQTGPTYPPGLQPGDNAIGKFIIGVSPIGEIFPTFSSWRTIISQYANSPIITTLITNFEQYLEQDFDFTAFFDYIWNVNTAQGYGLDVWGRIVNVSRTLTISSGSPFLGFAEAGAPAESFGFGGFYDGSDITTNFDLADDAYRTLIFAKALSNICDGSIPAINQLLMTLFPNRGNAFVIDNGTVPSGPPFFGFAEAVGDDNIDGFNQQPFYPTTLANNMTMTYTFNFILSPVELAIVEQSGVLPKPTGVAVSVVQGV